MFASSRHIPLEQEWCIGNVSEEGGDADDLLGALKSMSIASPQVEATGSVLQMPVQFPMTPRGLLSYIYAYVRRVITLFVVTGSDSVA